MHVAVDVRDDDLGLKENASPYLAYYFVFFILIGGYFILNFLTAVIFIRFSLIKKHESSLAALMLSPEQYTWVEVMHLIPKTKPVILNSNDRWAHSPIRLFVNKTVTN